MGLVIAVGRPWRQRRVGSPGLPENEVTPWGRTELHDEEPACGIESDFLVARAAQSGSRLRDLEDLAPRDAAVVRFPDWGHDARAPIPRERNHGDLGRVDRVHRDAGLGIGEVRRIGGLGRNIDERRRRRSGAGSGEEKPRRDKAAAARTKPASQGGEPAAHCASLNTTADTAGTSMRTRSITPGLGAQSDSANTIAPSA